MTDDTNTTSTEPSIGFIGLGNMGGRMARCITQAGLDLLGFDTRAESITEAGARPAESAADVVATSC